MVAPTKIIAGLGLSLGIDILEAPGATGDYRTLLTSKATAISKALSAPLDSCPNVFVPGQDEHRPGRSDGYDFGFLHIKVVIWVLSFIFDLYIKYQNFVINTNRLRNAGRKVINIIVFHICQTQRMNVLHSITDIHQASSVDNRTSDLFELQT